MANPARSNEKRQESAAVLMVDDRPSRQARWCRMLTRHHLPYLAASSPAEAIEALKHERPGVLVVSLEKANGEAAALLERVRTADARLPIILIEHANLASSLNNIPIQSRLEPEATDHALLVEIMRWLQDTTPTTPRPSAAHARWPGSVLIVDDEPKLCDVLAGFLTSHGFTVLTAGSGFDALAEVQRSHPTVMLLDVRMPGMDGLATLRQLKTVAPEVAVIMVTGLEEEHAMEEALALGASDYILKPFNLEYLETILLNKILLGRAP